jgi:TorA maturation chaperone TorD
MITPASLTQNQKQAILESLEKLCSLFWGPSTEKCREILSDNYFLSFEILNDLLDHQYMDTIQNIKEIVLDFSDTESFFNFLEETYVRLFINTRGGISAPLYHSCYLDCAQTDASPAIMGETAVLMTQRFESKGLSIADTISEPPDHLSIEIEYLFFLLKNGWETQNNDYLAEAASFAESFMMPWISQFCDRLSGEQNYPFYSHAATLLKSNLSLIARLG